MFKAECAGVTWSLHFYDQPHQHLSPRALGLNSGLRPELTTLWSDPSASPQTTTSLREPVS